MTAAVRRVAIITGGGSGIGAALAGELINDGVLVVLADIDLPAAQRTAQRLSGLGPGRAEAAELDVIDAAAVMTLWQQVHAQHGRLDLVVNNAGIGMGGATDELSLEHWDRAIDVNLRGVVHGVRAALPIMLEQGEGTIVNTASLAGLIPSPGLAPYAATKHAVVGMTLSLRLEYESRGIRFITLCPGFTDTPILDKSVPPDLPPVESVGPVREMAEGLPGGVYDVESLAADIRRGIARNDALVVAPLAARVSHKSFRASPGLFLRALRRGAEQSSVAGQAREDSASV